MNLPAIKQIALNEMADNRGAPWNERGAKYAHGERVAALAVRLRRLILPDEDGRDETLTVAAWFHDICNDGVNGGRHAVSGANRTRDLLAAHCTAEELEQICGLIVAHDDRKSTGKQHSNIVRIHQDADHLDHFGSLDIWRRVTYTAGHNETISDALDYLQNRWPDDCARWRGELHFELSKRIFDDKAAFVKTFIERFAVEGSGGIFNEGAVLGDL